MDHDAAPPPLRHPVAAPGPWPDPEHDPRDPSVVVTDERSNVVAYLHHYRLTLERKCAGLDAEQLARRAVPPSPLSLLGLVRHLTDAERFWFRRRIGGQDVVDVYSTPDDPDAAFLGATDDVDVVEQAFRLWRAEIAHSEDVVAGVRDLSATIDNGTQIRDVLVHMVEEYARHSGHADLLRECVDGRTGQ